MERLPVLETSQMSDLHQQNIDNVAKLYSAFPSSLEHKQENGKLYGCFHTLQFVSAQSCSDESNVVINEQLFTGSHPIMVEPGFRCRQSKRISCSREGAGDHGNAGCL